MFVRNLRAGGGASLIATQSPLIGIQAKQYQEMTVGWWLLCSTTYDYRLLHNTQNLHLVAESDY